MASLHALPLPALDDAQIQRVARRDRRAAVELLVRKYRDRLVVHAMHVLKDAQEAGDVCQEVFIKAMREPRFFEDDFKMKAWLFRVTSNLCFNIVRDRKRRGAILETMPKQTEIAEDPLTAAFSGERQKQILAAMEQVSEDHREILALRYYSDLSYVEIAEVLDIKLGTVMSRLSRARLRLMEALTAQGGSLDAEGV